MGGAKAVSLGSDVTSSFAWRLRRTELLKPLARGIAILGFRTHTMPTPPLLAESPRALLRTHCTARGARCRPSSLLRPSPAASWKAPAARLRRNLLCD